MALKLNKAHTDLMAAIMAGSLTHVGKTKEAEELAKDGYIEVNPAMLDPNGNAAVRLTEKGVAAIPATAPATAPTSAPVLSFVISDAPVELPSISRGGGGGREAKYPLADIPEGRALFIPAPEGKKPSALSKQFGSMVADFNKKHEDRYLTTRTLADGKKAGFVGRNADGTPNPDAYDGVAGIGIYRRPVSERKVKAKSE